MTRVILATNSIRRIPDAIVLDFRHRRVTRDGQVMKVAQNPFKVFACLIAAMPRTVRKWELIDCVYGEDFDGGPMCAEKCIDVYIHHARRVARFCGLRIVTAHGRGFYVVDTAPSWKVAA